MNMGRHCRDARDATPGRTWRVKRSEFGNWTAAVLLAAAGGAWGQTNLPPMPDATNAPAAGAPVVAAARDGWPVPGAWLRIRMEPVKGSPWPAAAGFCLLWMDGKELTDTPRVFTADGKEVGVTVLWKTYEGEPVKILFDCSGGGSSFFVYPPGTPDASGGTPPASPGPTAWEPRAGLVLETRQRGQGGVNNWQEFQKLWDSSSLTFSRSPVAQIHHGVHLHGPTRDFLSSYSGYLNIDQAGDYTFATVSADASFLQVDGQMVAEWPGWHGVHEGRRGEHNGTIKLAAGAHRLEYWNAQRGGDFIVSAAWKKPGQTQFEIIPPSAFVPLAEFETTAVQPAAGRPAEARFKWEAISHVVVDDLTLILAKFSVIGPATNASCRWSFDDGGAAEGPEVRRIFFRAGLRQVKLETRAADASVASRVQRVPIHPRWDQLAEWPDQTFQDMKIAILAMDLAPVAAADLDALVRLAARIEDRELLNRLVDVCAKRGGDFLPDYSETFLKLAAHCQHPDVRRYREANELARAVIRGGPDGSAPVEKARLRLADLLVNATGKAGEALEVLKAVDERPLAEPDRRRRALLTGDAALAQGSLAAARSSYAAAGSTLNPGDAQAALKRRARLETARDYLRAREWDASARIAEEIEEQNPSDRLEAETGLILVQAQMGRQEYPLALHRCQRMLRCDLGDAARSEILLRLVECARALGFRRETEEAKRTLLEDYPYSEAAAVAKEKWNLSPRPSREKRPAPHARAGDRLL